MTTKRILLVDDDKDALDLMQLCLQKYGHTIFTAASGVQGVTIYTIEQPDIVFLDIMMPGIDGFSVLKKMRSLDAEKDNEKTPPVIVMLTAKDSSEDVLSAIKLGANDYVVKPVTEERILEKLKRHVGF